MKKIFVFIFWVWLPTGFITVDASDFAIPDIRVDVTITEDGMVQIDEHRTYRFNGSFSWADYRLPKQGFTEIRNIRISEQDQSYINENTGRAGTFSVSESSDAVIVKWHYSATDTVRTFTVSYELAGTLMVGPEWTEFFWNYIAAGREKPTESLQIEIELPEHIHPDSIYAWTRGARGQTTLTTTPGTLEAESQQLSRNQSVRIRTLFPTTLLNRERVTVTDPNLSLEWAIQDEETFRQRQAEREERAAFYASITRSVTLVIIMLSLGIFVVIYRKYGKRHSTGTLSNRETVIIPDRIEPALAGRLLYRHTTSHHLVATIFDLARRGWFEVKEEELEKKGFFSFLSSESSQFRISRNHPDPDDSLQEWEKMAVAFAEKRIAAGNDLFKELFKGTDTGVSKWYSSWKKELKQSFDQLNWIDKESYRGVFWNVGLQSILLIGAVFMLVNGTGFALLGILTVGMMMIASFGVVRRTPAGEEKFHRWKAYREGLKNADRRTIRMGIPDRHFIYAIALQLSQKQLTGLIETLEQERGQTTLFAWIYLTQGSSYSPATMASAVTTLAASGTTSFAGTSGGSGASSGSSGGGASGGAG